MLERMQILCIGSADYWLHERFASLRSTHSLAYQVDMYWLFRSVRLALHHVRWINQRVPKQPILIKFSTVRILNGFITAFQPERRFSSKIILFWCCKLLLSYKIKIPRLKKISNLNPARQVRGKAHSLWAINEHAAPISAPFGHHNAIVCTEIP